MNPMTGRFRWKYQQKKHLLEPLLLGRGPRFVYHPDPGPLEGEIPVFTFHFALPDWFEADCAHLARNGYRTVSSTEFEDLLPGRAPGVKNTVLVTFDDGLKQVWTVAYPLLKKYGLRATCFLIPGCIPPDDRRVRPTLEDVWAGRASEAEVVAIRPHEAGLATWEEIRLMQASGVVDFQSHTMYHSLVYTSPEVHDFIHPGYDCHFYGNIQVPLYRRNGLDQTSRTPLLGLPMFRGAPRMQVAARYIEDESATMRCVEAVAREGAEQFFRRRDWRRRLGRLVGAQSPSGRFESAEERDAALVQELRDSRLAIEQRLGNRVTQLCFPWYAAADHALLAARQAGFRVTYFGQLPGRGPNPLGQSLWAVPRVEDVYVRRLPGSGRMSARGVFRYLAEQRTLPARVFPRGRPGIVRDA